MVHGDTSQIAIESAVVGIQQKNGCEGILAQTGVSAWVRLSAELKELAAPEKIRRALGYGVICEAWLRGIDYIEGELAFQSWQDLSKVALFWPFYRPLCGHRFFEGQEVAGKIWAGTAELRAPGSAIFNFFVRCTSSDGAYRKR